MTYASAGADIDLSDNQISSESTVQPTGENSRATADANAHYHEGFIVEGADSRVTITVNYTLMLDLSTTVPGDSALGRARVDLEFGNHDSEESLRSNDEIPGEVLDGDSLPGVPVTGTLTLSLDFLQGDRGYFTLSADSLGDVFNFLSDGDNDGVPDVQDNCPGLPNPDQTDTDVTGWGMRVTPAPKTRTTMRTATKCAGMRMGAPVILTRPNPGFVGAERRTPTRTETGPPIVMMVVPTTLTK